MLLMRPIELRWQCSWRFSLFLVGLAALVALATSGLPFNTARAAEQQDKPPDVQKVANKEGEKLVPPEERAVLLTYQCAVVDQETGKGIANAKVSVTAFEGGRGIGAATHISDEDGKF